MTAAVYCGTKTGVKINVGLSRELDITVSVHQGSILSPMLITAVMGNVKEGCITESTMGICLCG